jgi:hypothetical protein
VVTVLLAFTVAYTLTLTTVVLGEVFTGVIRVVIPLVSVMVNE